MNVRVDLRLTGRSRDGQDGQDGQAMADAGPRAWPQPVWTELSRLGRPRLRSLVECCVDTMTTAPDNVDLQTRQIKIMAELFQQAGQTAALDRMLLQECLNRLAAAMQNHQQTAELHAQSCCALHVMASTLGASLTGLHFGDVVSQVVEAMETEYPSYVQRWSARALSKLSPMLDPAARERAEGALRQLTAPMPVAFQSLQRALSSQGLRAPPWSVAPRTRRSPEPPSPSGLQSHQPDLQPRRDGRRNSIAASVGRLLGLRLQDAPEGIQVCLACNKIFEGLTSTRSEVSAEWLTTIRQICDEAQQDSQQSDVWKMSVFGLMPAEAIKHFLLRDDHKRWKIIEAHTEHFLDLLDEPGTRVALPTAPPPDTSERVTPPFSHPHPDPDRKWRSLRPVVLDQSIREPATNTPFGHTGYMKYLTLRIIRKMKFNDIAITGQYYGEKYTPETQVLEWIKYMDQTKWERDRNGELVEDPMRGLVAMFAPGEHDRKAGIQSIKDFKIPNAFLDLAFKASVRFKDADFVKSVIDAVEELDEIYSGWGWQAEWRSEDAHINNKFARGEISINLVDLMEYLNLRGDGTMEKQKMEDVEKAFQTWKENEAFQRRVVAILVEEGRGVADYEDYGMLVSWIRGSFPVTDKYRILVHAHAGTNNHQDGNSCN